MKIYYYANQIYQFSYALPIYREVGGKIIISRLRKILQFKRYLRNTNIFSNIKTFLSTPQILRRDRKNLYDVEGIIVSLSNVILKCNHEACKTIFIGHGTGDKKYGSDEKILEGYDYHFISGPKHLQKLIDLNLKIPYKKLIKIGNLRFDDYVNKKIDRNNELDRLGIIDRTRKNVLYAPTWKWGDGTLDKYVHKFAQEITEKHNLIVRPHHHDRQSIPFMKLWAKMNRIRNIYFSNPAAILKNDTMHDFIASDIIISDTSSILYEYLITGNPIIVAKNNYKDLHNMPKKMNVMNYTTTYDGSQNILKLIDENLDYHKYKEAYVELLHNCFYFNDGKSVERALSFINSITNK